MVFVCLLFPSHSLWPHAPGGEGEAPGGGLGWHGPHAPWVGWPAGPGQTFIRVLSQALPPHQKQGQGHPLRQDQRQLCESQLQYSPSVTPSLTSTDYFKWIKHQKKNSSNFRHRFCERCLDKYSRWIPLIELGLSSIPDLIFITAEMHVRVQGRWRDKSFTCHTPTLMLKVQAGPSHDITPLFPSLSMPSWHFHSGDAESLTHLGISIAPFPEVFHRLSSLFSHTASFYSSFPFFFFFFLLNMKQGRNIHWRTKQLIYLW